MDLPQPPQDQDLRNIIDKLAQFVARNGPEFEKMTKTKQKNNPKFSFLYGGEYFNYYQYKVTTEQAILKQSTGQRSASGPPSGGFMPPSGQYNIPQQTRSAVPSGLSHSQLNLAASMANSPNLQQWLAQNMAASLQPPAQHSQADIDRILSQQSTLQDQIKQSESNLNAQHTVLIQQQQLQIEDVLIKAQAEMIQNLAEETNISLFELDDLLKPIIETCTKDSISAGKGWILSHALNHESGKLISQYLLKKVIQQGATFSQKLHIIYLVNDVLHHCARKNAEDLKKSLENVVVPMFCNTSIAVTEEQETKLSKLLKLWESKSNYFSPEIIEKMKKPSLSYQEYQSNLMKQHSDLIAPLIMHTKTTFDGYQGQHQVFITHTLQQIQQLELQKQAIEQQVHMSPIVQEQPVNSSADQQNSNFQGTFTEQLYAQMGNYNHPSYDQSTYDQQSYNNDQKSYSNDQQSYSNQNYMDELIDNNIPTANGQLENENSFDGQTFERDSNRDGSNANEDSEDVSLLQTINFSLPPPGFMPPSFQNGFPDLSKPPPGFTTYIEDNNDDLMPSVPYYELPAGLMVPLIMLEDSEYRPLDPDTIRLPPPAPPNDRLLAAIEAFYAPPDHERPRDSEGWEKLGLYEYYKAKNNAKKQKDDAIKSGVREKSKSPSPIPRDLQKPSSPQGRRYRSKSRSKSPSKSPSPETTRRSTATSGSRRRDRDRENREGSSQSDNNRSRARRRSRSHSRSRSPPSNFGRERSSSAGNNNISKHRTERSPTPPSFLGSTFNQTPVLQELDSSNKGHQMLRKMGWGEGGGLGAAGQGISAPISGGEIRDRQDQYKGVGVNLNDPYENFRKNKGAAFITRMKERALERT